MFDRGQKIVCVDDEGHYGHWPLQLRATLDGLTKGRVYTVRAVGYYRKASCVWLEEIRRPITLDFGECGFAPQRFRPLPKRGTAAGMAMLKRIAQFAEEQVP